VNERRRRWLLAGLGAGLVAFAGTRWLLPDPHGMSFNCWSGPHIQGVVNRCLDCDSPYGCNGYVPIAKARLSRTLERRMALR